MPFLMNVDKNRKAEHVHVCFEATGGWSEEVAIALSEAGHIVSLVNPARIKAFAQSEMLRTKTDGIDAALIARFCRLHQPKPWSPPAPAIRILQGLVHRQQSLIEMRVEEETDVVRRWSQSRSTAKSSNSSRTVPSFVSNASCSCRFLALPKPPQLGFSANCQTSRNSATSKPWQHLPAFHRDTTSRDQSSIAVSSPRPEMRTCDARSIFRLLSRCATTLRCEPSPIACENGVRPK